MTCGHLPHLAKQCFDPGVVFYFILFLAEQAPKEIHLKEGIFRTECMLFLYQQNTLVHIKMLL